MSWVCGTRLMQCCNVLQAVVAILPSSKCLPDGVKATCSHFSSDAYVQMALHGYSLRKSFTTACQLLHRHKRRMRDCQGSACTAVLPGKVSSICHASAIIMTILNSLPAHIELSTCGTSFVSPKQSAMQLP